MSDRSSSSRISLSRSGSGIRSRKVSPQRSYSISPGLVWSTSDILEVQKVTSKSEMESESKIHMWEFARALDELPTEPITNDEEFKKVISGFLDQTRDKLTDWVNNTITFAGFDAALMRKKISGKVAPRKILIAVMVGLVRGNNIERISKTMKSTESQKEFMGIVKTLYIKKNVGGDFSAVTLSRMVACFPEIVCYMLHNADIQMAVPFTEMQHIHPEYPRVARHQVCASILPHSLSPSDLNRAFDVILVPYLKVSEVIITKVKEWAKLTPASKAETSSMYLHNSYNSKVLTLEERVMLSKKYNIVNNQVGLSTTWIAASKKASQWLKERYDYTHSEA